MSAIESIERDVTKSPLQKDIGVLTAVPEGKLDAALYQLPPEHRSLPVVLRGTERWAANIVYAYDGSNNDGRLRYFFEQHDEDLVVRVFRDDELEGIGAYIIAGLLRKESGVIVHDQSFLPAGIFYKNDGLWIAQRWSLREEREPRIQCPAREGHESRAQTPDDPFERISPAYNAFTASVPVEQSIDTLAAYEFHDDYVVVEETARYLLDPLIIWLEEKTRRPQRERIMFAYAHREELQWSRPLVKKDYLSMPGESSRGRGIPGLLPPELAGIVRVASDLH